MQVSKKETHQIPLAFERQQVFQNELPHFFHQGLLSRAIAPGERFEFTFSNEWESALFECLGQGKIILIGNDKLEIFDSSLWQGVESSEPIFSIDTRGMGIFLRVIFEKNSKDFVSLTADGMIRIWNLETGKAMDPICSGAERAPYLWLTFSEKENHIELYSRNKFRYEEWTWNEKQRQLIGLPSNGSCNPETRKNFRFVEQQIKHKTTVVKSLKNTKLSYFYSISRKERMDDWFLGMEMGNHVKAVVEEPKYQDDEPSHSAQDVVLCSNRYGLRRLDRRWEGAGCQWVNDIFYLKKTQKQYEIKNILPGDVLATIKVEETDEKISRFVFISSISKIFFCLSDEKMFVVHATDGLPPRPLMADGMDKIFFMESTNFCEIVTMSEDGAIRIWSLETETCQHTIKSPYKECLAVNLASDGRRLVTTNVDEEKVFHYEIWDWDSSEIKLVSHFTSCEFYLKLFFYEDNQSICCVLNSKKWETYQIEDFKKSHDTAILERLKKENQLKKSEESTSSQSSSDSSLSCSSSIDRDLVPYKVIEIPYSAVQKDQTSPDVLFIERGSIHAVCLRSGISIEIFSLDLEVQEAGDFYKSFSVLFSSDKKNMLVFYEDGDIFSIAIENIKRWFFFFKKK